MSFEFKRMWSGKTNFEIWADEMEGGIEEMAMSAGDLAAQIAAGDAPQDTGALAASMEGLAEPTGEPDEYYIGVNSDSDYAATYEEGLGGWTPNVGNVMGWGFLAGMDEWRQVKIISETMFFNDTHGAVGMMSNGVETAIDQLEDDFQRWLEDRTEGGSLS